MSIRVLVVDDSSIVRRIVTTALDGLPDIEVVGTAANGKIALAKIPDLKPDVVTLDIEMPVMDGIETMHGIHRAHPRLPVIMFSTLTERGAAKTFEALAAGARDYVTKPTNSSSLAESTEQIRFQLGQRIRALAAATRPASRAPSALQRSTGTAGPAVGSGAGGRADDGTRRAASAARVDAVGIGVSTGGPDALAHVLGKLPATLPVPVLIVQHMPPVFTRTLAERFDRQFGIRVVEASHDEAVQPGTVYIAPGDHHMRVARVGTSIKVRLDQGPAENFCRPAVDVLFRSLPEVYGEHLLTVMLTGMGSDGLTASRALAASGVDLYAQDKATSVVWGMPGAVTDAGLATKVLRLDQIASAIVDRVTTGRGGERR